MEQVWEFLKGFRTQTTIWRIFLSRWSCGHIVATTMCVQQGCTYTHLLHAHFSVAQFVCAHPHIFMRVRIHKWRVCKNVFAYVSFLFISPSPFSCLTHLLLCLRTTTREPPVIRPPSTVKEPIQTLPFVSINASPTSMQPSIVACASIRKFHNNSTTSNWKIERGKRQIIATPPSTLPRPVVGRGKATPTAPQGSWADWQLGSLKTLRLVPALSLERLLKNWVPMCAFDAQEVSCTWKRVRANGCENFWYVKKCCSRKKSRNVCKLARGCVFLQVARYWEYRLRDVLNCAPLRAWMLTASTVSPRPKAMACHTQPTSGRKIRRDTVV